ncbi:MAG TPA: class I SAM-dependent methyltransferase [Micromonospora sp.]
MTMVKAGLAGLAGLAVGGVAWWLGPEVGVPVALGALTTGGALAVDHARVKSRRAIGRQRDALAKLQATADRLAEQTARRQDVWNSEKRVRESADRTFAQTEAMINLHQLVRVQSGMPATRGWAASPDFLLLLVSLVEQYRPRTIVDLGSGSTTLWMASAMRTYGVEGRIVAIDNEEKYAQLTRDALVAHGLEKFAEVRHAAISDTEFSGETWPWYDREMLADVENVDLLVVDGPPGVLRKHARYPALPALADRLAPQARIVVDDYGRPDEKELVARWREEFPGWRLRELAHEKGCAVLSRG